MTAADLIRDVLTTSCQPADIERAVQMARDLEAQVAAVVKENRKLHRAHIRQENDLARLQDLVRYHAAALAAATTPEERP